MKNLITLFTLSLAFHVGIALASDFTITSSKTKGGTIQPLGKTTLSQGSNQPYTATASSGYYLNKLIVDGIPIEFADHTTASYNFENIAAKHKIAAIFALNPIITAKAEKGGAVTPTGKTSVVYGGSQVYTISANEGYELKDVMVDGIAKGPVTIQEFTNVTQKHSLKAKFVIKTYTITSNSGGNGSIAPTRAVLKHNGNKTFTIKPNSGYQIDSVTVNGIAQTGLPSSGSYKLKLKSVTENTEIAAIFRLKTANSVKGLAVGNQISVVDVQQPNEVIVPDDSDYNNDKTNLYVHEKAGEAFSTVNAILCMIEQTKYSDSQFVNQGFFKAMVDSGRCEGNDSAENSGNSAQAGTSANTAPTYDTWIAKSERSSENSNHILTAYVHTNKGDGGPENQAITIQAKVEVSEAATETNPLGLFRMNYKGTMDENPGQILMKGILKTELVNGKVMIRYAEQEGPDNAPFHIAKATFTRDAAADTGNGSAYQLEQNGPQSGGIKEGTIDFAYNPNFFERVDASNGQGTCLDRKKFETSAWRYGLYSSPSGSRANLNGGFPVNTKANGSGMDGYLSYYGLHFPPNVPTLNDGDLIYKGQWENGVHTSTPYTLVIKNGKLKRHTRSLITLDDIKNIPLEGAIPTPGNMGVGNTMYRVTWDGSELAIRASAEMNPNGPPAWIELSPAKLIDDQYVLPFSNLGMYSQSLGGQLNIQLQNCSPVELNNPGSGFKCDTPNAATTVVFYEESMVTPAETIPSILTCYENCPKAETDEGMDGTSQQTMTYPQQFAPGSDNHHDYSLSNMLLKDSATGFNVVLMTAPVDRPWGYNSGPLFDPSQTNKAKLACDWDNTQTCGWKAWNVLDEFFTWETGPNFWNQYTAIKDASDQIVNLDPPWQVAYTYPVDGTHGINSPEIDDKYSGTKFFLQYSGFGNLQGIPGKCVNPNDPSQSVTDCSQPGLRWVPEFMIPTGSMVTMNAAEYLTKALDIEQRMSKSPGSCNDLSPVDMSDQWLDIKKDWVNPNLPDEPAINEPPQVIGGIIQ